MKYEEYINELVNTNQIVGMNTCIVKDKKHYANSFGCRSIVPERIENNNLTLYDTASLTKVLTVLPIICRLIDNKEIKFETKLKFLLSEFKYDDVTIYDVLTHTSGMPASVDMRGKEQSKESLINEILKLDKTYQTGTNVEYSDLAYILLGLAIERMYNEPLDKVAKEEVFDPLRMYSTTYNPKNKEVCAPTEYTDASQSEVYTGVVHDWKARLMEGVAGHAGVFSTAIDIGKYMKMALNNGYYDNKRYISRELIDMWFKTLVYESGAKRNRSLCWIVGNNRLIINGKGDNVISFHGFAGPSISLDRDNHLGICLMSNSVHPIRSNKDKLNAVRPIITDKIYEDSAPTLSMKKR